MRRDAFNFVHPAVSMLFFLFVTLITAFVLNPVITGISLAAACVYYIMIKGKKGVLFCLSFALPVMLLVAVINPLFNHAGTRILFYLWNGNAVTLEAVLYGVNSACMFAALIIWCACLTGVMSADKYVCLFGRLIPTLSLLFSMVLRFVPRLLSRIRRVSAAQLGVAPPIGKSPVKGVKHGLSVVSVTVSWALESAVNMSDSMKSRGYGLKGRTSYSLFRFDGRDLVLTAVLVVSFAASCAACALKAVWFRYYPSIKFTPPGFFPIAGCAAFALLCFVPVLLNVKEDITWRILRSRI